MAQERVEAPDRLQRWNSPLPVLNGGAMNDQPNHEAVGVGDDMALAALHLLARIIAANSTAFSGLDALAIDDAGPPQSVLPTKHP